MRKLYWITQLTLINATQMEGAQLEIPLKLKCSQELSKLMFFLCMLKRIFDPIHTTYRVEGALDYSAYINVKGHRSLRKGSFVSQKYQVSDNLHTYLEAGGKCRRNWKLSKVSFPDKKSGLVSRSQRIIQTDPTAARTIVCPMHCLNVEQWESVFGISWNIEWLPSETMAAFWLLLLFKYGRPAWAVY